MLQSICSVMLGAFAARLLLWVGTKGWNTQGARDAGTVTRSAASGPIVYCPALRSTQCPVCGTPDSAVPCDNLGIEPSESTHG